MAVPPDGPVEHHRRDARRQQRRLAAERAHNLRHLAGAKQRVDLGNLLPQLIAIPLRQAPRHHEPARRRRLLQLGHLENRVDGLLLRAVDERTGIHDDDIRVGRMRRQLVSRLPGKTEHDLAVDEVLGAAEGNQTDFHRRLQAAGCRRQAASGLRPESACSLQPVACSPRGTVDKASSDKESSPVRARGRRSRRRRARCPCRSRRGGPSRSGGDPGTTRTLRAAGCVP